MLIIWSGWGFLVPVINVLAFVLFGACLGAFEGLQPAPMARLIFIGFDAIVFGGLSGLGIFLFAQRMGARPGRVLIDPQTNEQVVLRRPVGSLFFVPMRYWAFITLAAWAIGAAMVIASGGKLS